MSTEPRDTGVGAAVGRVVGAVVRQAVRDAGAAGLVVLDDGSPEARLCREWCASALGSHAVAAAPVPGPDAVRACAAALALPSEIDAAAELHRLHARLLAERRDALVANPANKTALLLAGRTPPEPILPLGDLYASRVARLAGGWSAPARVREIASAAGGIDRLDAALLALFEERRPADEALAPLGPRAGERVRLAIERGRFARRRVGLVPKLSARTLGIDLFA